MPPVPTLREEPVQIGVPRYPTQNGVAQGLYKAFGALGDIAAESQKQQDALDAARLHGEYEDEFNQAVQNIKQSQPDYLKRPDDLRKRALEIQQQKLSQAGPGAQQVLKLAFARQLPEKMREFNASNLKEWGFAREAELDKQLDTIAGTVATAKDPAQVENYKGLARALIQNGQTGPAAYLNPDAAYKKQKAFLQTIDLKRARVMIGNDPSSFLRAADGGEFKNLTEDQITKLREDARQTEEREQRRQDKIFTDTQKDIHQGWSAAANQGLLRESDLNDALTGKNPFITPDMARTLKTINDNPPTGEGADAIGGIMTEYHLKTPSFGAIAAARAKLLNLQKQGVKGQALSKAADELQTDERTMLGIDAAKMGRDIQTATDRYNAEHPAPPINLPIFTNQRKADEAKIKDAVRKGASPDEAIKGVIQRSKNQIEQIPQKMKDVMDAAQ